MWNNDQGEFVRYHSTFRHWIRREGSTPFRPEKDRYHLYISWACPWASRTVIMRALKGLEDVISLSVVDPIWDDKGWKFSEGPGCIPDTVNHCTHLVDIYRLADPQFSGEESVPVLWDRKLKTIVNNESIEIMRMMDLEFEGLARNAGSYYPEQLRQEIDATIEDLYSKVNNGVYRAGFASSQKAYEKAVKILFQTLDQLEERLSSRRYLCGNQMTEADICLFTTLFRFDLVYYSHFKCNIKHLSEYSHLNNYLKDIYQHPGIAAVCNADHCKRHYYGSQLEINPTGIIPVGPSIDFSSPHDRNRF